jgi:hypothetical protein
MPPSRPRYADSVFINCPFDSEYGTLMDAVVFTVHDCGFVARTALELPDSGRTRLDRLVELIGSCKYGIHDLSRTELDPLSRLPRMNMPLELGLFLGAQRYGTGRNRDKVTLVLDTERYRYQKFISDIAGQDPAAHGGKLDKAITVVRDWLRGQSTAAIPGGKKIFERYQAFRTDLPLMCDIAELDPTELTAADYTGLVTAWLREHRRPA